MLRGADTKEKILNNLKKSTRGKGNIVLLMHEKMITYQTLDEIIDYLEKEGYTFDNFYNIMN